MGPMSFEYTFDADVENRVLYSKIYGIFKATTTVGYVRELKEQSKELIKQPWSKIVDLANFKTLHPEVAKEIGEMNNWCRDNKMEWTIYVIDQQVGYSQLMRVIETGKYRDITKVFRTLKEADDFLETKGYKIRKDSSSIFK